MNVNEIVLGRKIREKNCATTTFRRHAVFHKTVKLTTLSNQHNLLDCSYIF